MNSLYETEVHEYATRGVLVDANILLLYGVGGFDRHLIAVEAPCDVQSLGL